MCKAYSLHTSVRHIERGMQAGRATLKPVHRAEQDVLPGYYNQERKALWLQAVYTLLHRVHNRVGYMKGNRSGGVRSQSTGHPCDDYTIPYQYGRQISAGIP